jgi:hypothetical protein
MSAKIIRLSPRKRVLDQRTSAAETIDRLRTIARESDDHLILADGPVSPDAALIGFCGDALYLLRRADTTRDKAWSSQKPYDDYTPSERIANELLWREAKSLVYRAKTLMRRVAKIPAQSPAGIYAKALLVQSSRTGAQCLARTLAEDLVACPSLRESLWPEAVEGGAA